MAEHNLALLAEELLARNGDYESLWFEGRWHRSGELAERARRLAAGLAERGVAPGDRVVVFAANSPEVSIVYNAVWRAGAVVTPVIFLLPPAELRHVLASSEPALVVTSPEFADTARSASDTEVVSTDELPDAEPTEIVPRADGDLAALLYTGGTTGRAKGVMLSHSNLWYAGKAGSDASYLPGVNRGLGALPLSHAYGLLVTVVGLHAVEPSVVVLMRWFQPAAFLELVQEHRIQTTALVPSMLRLLLAEPLEQYDLSSLRYVVSGAAPLTREVLDELRRRLPTAEVREGYGLTETSGVVAGNRPGRVRAGTVGTAMPGAEVRIVDDRDEALPPGEVGEICCRSPFVMLGYWREPGLTAEASRGGWLHTGDLGFLDEDGYLTVVDRKKDLIIRGGFNVYPRDVEDAIMEHPDVDAAGVIGRADAAHGEEVVAFVSLRTGSAASADELVAFAKDRLGGYKYPREVRVVPSIPLTAVGKVDRKALRALVDA